MVEVEVNPITGWITVPKVWIAHDIGRAINPTLVRGQVEGSVDPKGNRLTIGPDGRLKANVTARAVVVQGKLEGNIQASERVDLRQSAVVVGDIVTQRITIEHGACIKGRIEVHGGEPSKEKSTSAAASSATAAPSAVYS